jgi:hypothetical protein
LAFEQWFDWQPALMAVELMPDDQDDDEDDG